jgi:predicted RNA methylase
VYRASVTILRISELKERLRGKGWQPARADAAGLFAALAEADRDEAEIIERALGRLGAALVPEIERRLQTAGPPLRGRLVRLLGRVGTIAQLLSWLGDEDPKTRRNAVLALGRATEAERGAVEAALVAAWTREPSVEMRRSLAATLGKVGGAAALALLDGERSEDPELARLLDEARLKLRRTLGRAGEGRGRVAGERRPPPGTEVVLRCREGLAEITAAALGRVAAARGVRVLDGERVGLRLDGPGASLAALWACRTFLRVEFPLDVNIPRRGIGELPPEGAAVVAALTAPATRALMAALTDGRPRWRLEWEGAGHRRGLTFRVAREVAARAPELENDPTESLWEVVARADGEIALWPRGLDDPRFAWRAAQVPASSHPTIAAALVEVAGARPEDVVWDPFCGAGSELVERALAGPYRALVGSDLDEGALAAARANLESAGVPLDGRVRLERGDATAFSPPEAPTVVITNPPMGRRVLDRHRTGALFEAFLGHAARVLAPGGRVAWIVPRGDETARAAAAAGFSARLRRRVDMAGFWAELQVLELLSIGNRDAASSPPPARPSPPSPRSPPSPPRRPGRPRPPGPARPSRGGPSRPGRR